jgi:hypothetical protein
MLLDFKKVLVFISCLMVLSCKKENNLITQSVSPPCTPNDNYSSVIDGNVASMGSFTTSIDNNSNNYWVSGNKSFGTYSAITLHINSEFNPVPDGEYEAEKDFNGKGSIGVTYVSYNNSTGNVSWQGGVGEKVFFQTDSTGKRIITLCDFEIRNQSNGNVAHIDARLVTPR